MIIKQLFRDLTFVFILYFILLPNPMFFSPQNVPLKKKISVGSMYVKEEVSEREKSGKGIDRN